MSWARWKTDSIQEQQAFLCGVNDALAAISKGTIQIFEDWTHVEEALALNKKSNEAIEKIAHALLVLHKEYKDEHL